MLGSEFFPKKCMDFEQVKRFLIDNRGKEIDSLDDIKLSSIKDFVEDSVNALVESNNGTEKYNPFGLGMWSDKDLVNRAYYLLEYQGLLKTLCSKNNQSSFDNNYILFIEPFQAKMQNAIKSGNLFIAYLHVVKLTRQIINLSGYLCNPEPGTVILDQIDKIENQLILTNTNILSVKKEENQFWACALIALILHSRASIFYNANNPIYYDLERSRQLLSISLQVCDEGQAALAKLTDTSLINFYTIQESFLPTLSYQSFAEQKEAILKTGLTEYISPSI